MVGGRGRGRGRGGRGGGVTRTSRVGGGRTVKMAFNSAPQSTVAAPKTLDQRFTILAKSKGRVTQANRGSAASRQADARHMAVMAKRTGQAKENFRNTAPSRGRGQGRGARGKGRGVPVGRNAAAVVRPTATKAKRGRGGVTKATTQRQQKSKPAAGKAAGGGRGGGGRGRGRGAKGRGGGRGPKETYTTDTLDSALDTYMASAADVPME